MAIIFTTDISESNLLFAFNNNIVRFSSNQAKTPLHCDIVGLGMVVRIYPTPNNSFYFNLRDYVSSFVNSNRFADPVNHNLISGNRQSFVYDAEFGTFKNGPVAFQINFIDDTSEIISKNLNFLAGVVQIEAYKKQQIPIDLSYVVLSPVADRSNNNVYLKYWEGYPFEISFYTSKKDEPFKLLNTSTGIDFEFTFNSKVNSLFLSDARTDVTIEDFLPLIVGHNVLNIIDDGDQNENINITLNKVDSDCGVYIKWRNAFGRYNYWLLDMNHKRDRGFKYNPEIDNDYDNIDRTISPTVQTGKESQDILRCIAKRLTAEEVTVFSGLFESPKIYLFTGERFSRSSNDDWLEVRLNNTTAQVYNYQKKLNTFTIDLELPSRYMQSL